MFIESSDMANLPYFRKNSFSKWIVESVLREKDIGVEISEINLPGIPQYEEQDCFTTLIIWATSMGEVLIVSNKGIFSLTSTKGTSSSAPFTVDFDEKWLFKMLLFVVGPQLYYLLLWEMQQKKAFVCS